MKYIIASALCAILLASCGQDPSTPTTTTPDYFPLQIGNWWEYAVDTAAADGSKFIYAYTERVEIIDDSVVNGKKYYVVQYKQVGGNQINYLFFLNKDTEGRIVYSGNILPQNIHDSMLFVVYYFNKPKGEVWNRNLYSSGNYSEIYSNNDTTTVPAGVFSPNCVIKGSNDIGRYSDFSIFAPGIGMIKRYPVSTLFNPNTPVIDRGGIRESLTKAFINNVAYPR